MWLVRDYVCVVAYEYKNKAILTYSDLLLTDGVVGVIGQEVHGEWSTLPELGRQQETHCP